MVDHPLIRDIYSVVTEGSDVTEEQAIEFGASVGNIIANRLRETKSEKKRPFTLRMSNIGKCSRQLWYSKRYQSEEPFSGPTLIKFMFGDLVESLILFLAELSGHKVTAKQSEVNLDGIKGHIDADIDGVTVDVKSASQYAFKKFADGTLEDNDSFGYIEQISGYAKARDTNGAFLAVDKSQGNLAYLEYSKEDLSVFKVQDRIKHLKEIIVLEVEPERPYQDEDMGESGNKKLGINCSYCDFKDRCWSNSNGGIGLRTFLYSTGPVFLTRVVKEPKVFEKVKF